MQYVRVAIGNLKEKLLSAITTAWNHHSLKDCLESIGLTAARYHSWVKRKIKCILPDQSTCPKLSRQQMVFASVSAWYRICVSSICDSPVRESIRRNQSSEFARAKELIEKALEMANRLSAKVGVPNLFADDGTGNQNKEVDSLVEAGRILRTLVQIDVEFSNSMIEALFRSLKYRWLCILSLPTFEAVCRAVEEYLTDHNNRIPHYALGGAMPFEVFSGTCNQESQS